MHPLACLTALSDTSPVALLALAFLAPAGFALLAAANRPAEEAGEIALNAIFAFGLGAVVSFLCGFAFQFGGIGLWNANADLASLNVSWSALGSEYGRGWGMLGLRGFALGGQNATAGTLRLFLAQLPLLTTAIMIPMLALRRPGHNRLALLAGLCVALFTFPLLGNWTWGGGWLSQLGDTLGLGHGYVDLNGTAAVHVAGGLMALLGLWLLAPRRAPRPAGAPATWPDAHVSLAGILGVFVLPVSYWALLLAQPGVAEGAFSAEGLGVNLILGACGALLAAAAYLWFTTGRLALLGTCRGLAAGLIAVGGAAPFLSPWISLLIGALAGVLVPLAHYLTVERMELSDDGGVVSVHLTGGVLGILTPAFFATGICGAGWNGVGAASYLGIAGQGVTGLWAAAGRQVDWPGQMGAQAAGLGAALVVSALFSGTLFLLVRRIQRAWQEAGMEWVGGRWAHVVPSAPAPETSPAEAAAPQTSGPETISPEDQTATL